MAFLRQCLQELRIQQGEQNALLSNDPGWIEEHGNSSFNVDKPANCQSESLADKDVMSCFLPCSNPEFIMSR